MVIQRVLPKVKHANQKGDDSEEGKIISWWFAKNECKPKREKYELNSYW